MLFSTGIYLNVFTRYFYVSQSLEYNRFYVLKFVVSPSSLYLVYYFRFISKEGQIEVFNDIYIYIQAI